VVHSYAEPGGFILTQGQAGSFLRGPDTEYIYTLAAVIECNMVAESKALWCVHGMLCISMVRVWYVCLVWYEIFKCCIVVSVFEEDEEMGEWVSIKYD